MDELINKIVNLLSPSYIYKVGSSLVCDNPNDIDIVLIYDDSKKMKEASKKQHEVLTIDELVSNGICCNLLYNSLEYIYDTASQYPYEFGPYLIQLYGEKNIMEHLNILSDDNLKEKACNNMANEIILKMTTGHQFGSYIFKPYRLLLTCYILDNNSFELSDEQKTVLNKVHDERSMSDNLWRYCKQTIYNILKNEFNKEVVELVL